MVKNTKPLVCEAGFLLKIKVIIIFPDLIKLLQGQRHWHCVSVKILTQCGHRNSILMLRLNVIMPGHSVIMTHMLISGRRPQIQRDTTEQKEPFSQGYIYISKGRRIINNPHVFNIQPSHLPMYFVIKARFFSYLSVSSLYFIPPSFLLTRAKTQRGCTEDGL